jgi:excisionase family DNA binding protein
MNDTILADYLTPTELAQELKINIRTLARWRRLDEAPPVTKFGRNVLFRKAAVTAWLKSREEAA